MSEYVEKCPCCGSQSLEVTPREWGGRDVEVRERRCELCGFAVVPTLPTQAHVGNAVAFVSAACSWFEEKRLDIPLDEHLAEAIRSGAGALVFAGERKVSPEEAERLAEEFQREVIEKFFVGEADTEGDPGLGAPAPEAGSHLTLRAPRAAWARLRETLEADARSSAFDPELRREIREALDQVEEVERVAAPPSLVQAARDVLEWVEHMGGWEAPCWERLRRAVSEAAAPDVSRDAAQVRAERYRLLDVCGNVLETWWDRHYPEDVFDGSSGGGGAQEVVRIRNMLREAVAGGEASAGDAAVPRATTCGDGADAEAALRRIHDILYLDVDAKGDFHNPDKPRDDGMLDAIAEVVAESIPKPAARRRSPGVRRIRELDASDIFAGESAEWKFCREHAAMRHVEACEFMLLCDDALVTKAVERGCRRELVDVLRDAAARGREDPDGAWLWLYAG
jgi:hypothetical protein